MSKSSSDPRSKSSSESSSKSSYDAGERREESPDALPDTPACPFCEGTQTEIMSSFGSHASVATYWCRTCRSPFELLKWRGGRDG